jgi:hypothetical protein
MWMTLRTILPRFFTYLAAIAVWSAAYSSQSKADPFAFFEPSLTITAEDRAQLDRGEPVTHVLKSRGNELGLVGVIAVKADGDRLVEWVNQIEKWKKNPHVLAIRRFSNPPRLEDLEGLELDGQDVEAIRSCHPGSCEIKLSADEMKRLKQVRQGNAAVQQAFRELLLDRLQKYIADGQIPPDEDHHKQVEPSSHFESLLEHTPFLADRLPELAQGLQGRSKPSPGSESFFYWSKEHLARKAVVSITQVTIVRNHAPGLPDALVIGRDIFSSHYMNASLSVTALTRGDPGGPNYFVYLNRTDVDVLHGVFGGVVRSAIERHLRDASNVLEDFKKRLESGPPSGRPSSTS